MDSKQLKPWQAEKILAVVQNFVYYLDRLRQQMNARRFYHNDPLYVAVLDVMQSLNRLQLVFIDIILQRNANKEPQTTDGESRPPRSTRPSDQVRRGLDDRH